MALEGFQVLQEIQPERGRRVYLARSKGEKVVMIRVLSADAPSSDMTTALTKEASLGARLDHEAIVQTRSMILKDDMVAVVTDFLPGVSLQRLLRFAAGRDVRLPDVCAYYILERVLAALAAAHGTKGEPILHRAVAPESVIVGWDGTVKLADFGLARMRQIVGGPIATDEASTLMAPEGTRGEKLDARSDVFLAGLLAVRLLTGRTPYARFRASKAEHILAMAEGEVTPLAKTRPDMPAALREAIDTALEKDPAKRTVTAQGLLDALRSSTETGQGKAALAKLLGRWREPLEGAVTPWERRASLPDDVPEEAEGLMKPGTLALALSDERPSDGALIASGSKAPPEPWQKRDGEGEVPTEEVALKPTDPNTSLSRMGSIAPDALVMPLPAMRITMPELPTYGGPPVNVSVRPPPKQSVFSGKVLAVVLLTGALVLLGGAFILFRWLLTPPGPPPKR
ncbi:MAG: serine/threonine protein kinase [Labilithrix sp.]|nr:serine/threonine protein kinase [Labilithrix sp.]MCW5817967.1 serine/threonine protein kinase [Labilithrix sp.]